MRRFRMVSFAIACAVLSACGGGGGGGARNGTLTVPVTTLTFLANGPSAATPPPQTITGTVTGVTSGTLYISVVGTGPAVASISTVTFTNDTTGVASVSVPAPSTLGVGTYTGVITVRACLNDSSCATGSLQGSPQTINVTYHVAAIQASAASLDFSVNNAPSADALMRQATITGTPAQNWTATTNASWLSVTQNGSDGGVLNASVVQSALDALDNGAYTGSITVTPATAGKSLAIPVSLTVNRTQVNYVSPYVAYTGTSRSVIIRGDEFSQVTVRGVTFGSTPAQSFTVVSPTEIHATYPATLAPGRYPVRLQSDFSGVREFAELVVVDAPSFTAAAIPLPGTDRMQPVALIYDAERAAVAVDIWYSSSGATGLARFPSDGSTWSTPVLKSVHNMFGLALTADGTEWVAGSDKSVVHIDADDLATVATTTSPLFSSGSQYIREMAVASDGTIAMFGNLLSGCGAPLLDYKPRKRTFRTLNYNACSGKAGASGDGTRLLVGNEFSQFGTNEIFLFDSSTGTLAATGVFQLIRSEPVLDRTGSRIILQKTQVYDGSFASQGNLPGTTDAVVLHPDGTRAYAYDRSRLLRTYDLTAAPVGGIFPEIGAGIALAGDPGDDVIKMAITPDGRTVFIAGGAALIVQPTP